MFQSPSHPLRRQLAWLAVAAATICVLAALGPASAQAAFGIDNFDGVVLDQNGDPFTQAGGHPYSASATIEMNSHLRNGFGQADADVKNIDVDLPPGLLGNPQAYPTCTQAQFGQGNLAYPNCPKESQVGFARLDLSQGFTGVFAPVYNMVPPPGVPAEFAFTVVTATVYLDAGLRPGPGYGVSLHVRDISQGLGLLKSKVDLWGVPADPSHDPERVCFPNTNELGCSTDATLKPFISLPTSCLGPQLTSMRADSWANPGVFDTASFLSHDNATPPNPIGATGCEKPDFSPAMEIKPTTRAADSPTGLQVDLQIPQSDDPDGIASAHLKAAKVTLPEGMAINPAAAGGLGACSQAQIGLGTNDPVRCPDSSQIGTVQVDTPLLDQPLTGQIYQAAQNQNPFNSTFALYLVAESAERGIRVKLAGKISPDPETGQLVTTFSDNPQLPFNHFRLRFKGGDRAPLVTPPTCGTYQSTSEFSPWSAVDPDNPTAEETVIQSSSFTIDRGPNGGRCLAGNPSQPGNPADLANRPFNPQMNAGLQNPVAGAYSPFILRLTRQDGEQEILATTVTPPKGVTAKLTGVPLCSNARANAGTCPAASQIGEVIVGAGAGPSPFYIQPPNEGHVYMTGPYKGEQLGMLIQVPAKAGPFDLGLVNVRAAVHVDKHTAQLRVISDPIPQILEGVPLRAKDIRVLINRPDFTIAPTDCDPMSVQATIAGSSGAVAHLRNRFQVGGCASLGFNPRLKLDFGKRRKDTRRNQHPPLHANLNFNQGDANISRVQVALPKGVFLDQDRLGRICSRPNYAANTCPAESRVGYAKATTPLLDDPVEGPVYLKSSDNPLPDLAADLNGQIDIDLFGKIDQKENKKGLAQIRNTFDVVPDVPVSHFSLTLSGGKDGLLVNSRNICRKRRSQKISIEIRAHNEATLKQKPLIGSACKKINKKKAKKLRKKIKKLRRKAKKANSHKRAKRARHKGKKLKKQLRKLRR